METIMHNSLLFKNIFKSYQDFKNWYTSTPLSDSVEDVPSEKTFTLIAYEYNDSSVNSSIESFKQRFANDVYTYYKEFEATTKAIDELMRMIVIYYQNMKKIKAKLYMQLYPCILYLLL